MVRVREDARRSGLGGRLLGEAERVARARGCEAHHGLVLHFQAPAFYERHGFVEFARTEGLPVEGQADVHLVKLLGQQ